MEWDFQNEAHSYLTEKGISLPPLNLGKRPPGVVVQQSHCPNCKHKISWWENIPVISYVFFLRGKCRGCKNPISIQYPMVEILTGILFGLAFYILGLTPFFLFSLAFIALLISISGVDFKTTYIPDNMVYSLLWLGILSAAFQINPYTNVTQSVFGAAIGYVSLWSFFWVFKLLTGKEGMGYGDFKLLAALGAWLGMEALLPIIVIASISGSIVGIILLKKNKESKPFAFGPYLVLGGMTMILYQPQILSLIHP